MVRAGLVLLKRGAHRLYFVLRGAHDGGRLVLGKHARLAFGQQRGRNAVPVRSMQRLLELHTLLRVGPGQGQQRVGGFKQQRAPSFAAQQPVDGLVHAGHARVPGVKGRHRAVNMPSLVGQLKLDPARQRGAQGLVRVVAAQRAHQISVVIAQAGIGRHLPQKRPPQLGHGVFVVLQQLIGRGQAQLVQHRQRGRAQQRGKPAVKGADLHRAAVGEQGLI